MFHKYFVILNDLPNLVIFWMLLNNLWDIDQLIVQILVQVFQEKSPEMPTIQMKPKFFYIKMKHAADMI